MGTRIGKKRKKDEREGKVKKRERRGKGRKRNATRRCTR